ncbi:hypothetical protein PYCCODRAFT_332823 [Trametes coccinea BRFM310]|uniref:Uncharacterized protein n=1 Tax=Trametes coccinea (strain BRFM310) TaxID=1353009 RepID=A0A1Y2INI6_TRAC3|nr:hypothetical protein PYCCODRAFT_332823 [Trametes coccinea BRFM310]
MPPPTCRPSSCPEPIRGRHGGKSGCELWRVELEVVVDDRLRLLLCVIRELGPRWYWLMREESDLLYGRVDESSSVYGKASCVRRSMVAHAFILDYIPTPVAPVIMTRMVNDVLCVCMKWSLRRLMKVDCGTKGSGCCGIVTAYGHARTIDTRARIDDCACVRMHLVNRGQRAGCVHRGVKPIGQHSTMQPILMPTVPGRGMVDLLGQLHILET